MVCKKPVTGSTVKRIALGIKYFLSKISWSKNFKINVSSVYSAIDVWSSLLWGYITVTTNMDKIFERNSGFYVK